MSSLVESLEVIVTTLEALKGCPGKSGNISYWRTEDAFMSESGCRLSQLRKGQGIINFNDQHWPSNLSSEFPMHRAIYEVARPHLITVDNGLWVIHSHVPNTVALSVFKPWDIGARISCITHCLKESGFSNILYCVDGVPGTFELAGEVKKVTVQVLKPESQDPRAIILRGHGLVTFGTSMQEALDTHVLVEHIASILVKAPQAFSQSPSDL